LQFNGKDVSWGMPSGEIIAMGGGGFSEEPERFGLEGYVLRRARASFPTVCFLPTASGDDPQYIARFEAALDLWGCRGSAVTLTRPLGDWREKLLTADVIYVGGGRTRSMLAVWRSLDVPAVLAEASAAGAILCGVSAGAICWFECGLSDSVKPGKLLPLTTLGWLAGSCCPHYRQEPGRHEGYLAAVATRKLLPGYGIEDSVALHFKAGQLERVIASRPDHLAFKVEAGPNGVIETALAVDEIVRD
jgi:dipeptidase E